MKTDIYLDLGLKDNWREFKRIVETKKFHSALTTHYFVFNEDECDEAHIFHNQEDLDNWLEKFFWERERYETRNLEESMDDFKIWMLIDEERYKRLDTLYEGAKPTSIVINGLRYYRKLISVSVEQTVNISTNWY